MIQTEFYQSLAERVKHLDFSFKDNPTDPALLKLLRSTVLDGGKRIRPTLCLIVGEMFGAPENLVIPYAKVGEMVHAATLAHDDVIDEATTRRGKPTSNGASSNSQAVLAGDWLLARVVQESAGLGNLTLVQEVALVFEEMVTGEWLQFGRRGKIDVSVTLLDLIAEKKTGSLISWCCIAPCVISGGSKEAVELCRTYGKKVGVAFQMADDLLDYERNSDKPAYQDIRQGLLNYVTHEMIAEFPQLGSPIADLLIRFDEKKIPWNEEQLTGAVAKVKVKIERTVSEALECLDRLFIMNAQFNPANIPNPRRLEALEFLKQMTRSIVRLY
jgi:octaprenyl-diphosphate synthase